MSNKDDLVLEFLRQLKDGQDDLKDKQEKILSEQIRMDSILTINTASLNEHIRRTKMLEDRMDPVEKDYENRVVVRKFKIGLFKKIGAFIGILGTIAGLIAYISNYIKH